MLNKLLIKKGQGFLPGLVYMGLVSLLLAATCSCAAIRTHIAGAVS
jgi:hypothetical protein